MNKSLSAAERSAKGGRRGGLAHVPKGFAKSGKASSAGTTGMVKRWGKDMRLTLTLRYLPRDEKRICEAAQDLAHAAGFADSVQMNINGSVEGLFWDALDLEKLAAVGIKLFGTDRLGTERTFGYDFDPPTGKVLDGATDTQTGRTENRHCGGNTQ